MDLKQLQYLGGMCADGSLSVRRQKIYIQHSRVSAKVIQGTGKITLGIAAFLKRPSERKSD